MEDAGSSPRIRGEYRTKWLPLCSTGIIPANTGRIQPRSVGYRRSTDHPREYGENPAPSTTQLISRGSSPRIRGELSAQRTAHTWIGIIPANTGRILQVEAFREGFGDHPREYGENPHNSTASFQPLGSSPRIRGECPMFVAAYDGEGIIPANTGRIPRQVRKRVLCGDHPREYGENPTPS